MLTVEAIHTYYGKSHILHGVSLEVRPGEVVGLLGRNGVGKSTTLKTIMGLIHPTEGRIVFEGQPIARTAPHRLARLGIGYVPEDRRIFRLLTVMENLRTGLDRRGGTDERGKTLLDRESVAILLVEQNVPLTLEVSDRIYIMEKGVVRHHAAAAALRSDDSVIHQYLGV